MPTSSMPTFLGLCLVSRLAYAFNDVLVGRRAREYGNVEVAALRGLSLGLTMAPLLVWVPAAAWGRLGSLWWSYVPMIILTASANVLQNQAARFLPFGLRAALMIGTVSILSVVLGAVLFSERLSLPQIVLCLVLIGSAVLAALGGHSAHEIQPHIPKGAALALGSGVGLALASALTKQLAMATDPLLTAWSWEFGAGAILLAPLLWQWRRGAPSGLGQRFARVAVASSPTVVGTGASMVALELGALGLWGALAGTQILFIAMLGVRWHREQMGTQRWLAFVATAAAIGGLALLAG